MSLTMLGMCINARASSATAHAPYRDSKLTRLLKARRLWQLSSQAAQCICCQVLLAVRGRTSTLYMPPVACSRREGHGAALHADDS